LLDDDDDDADGPAIIAFRNDSVGVRNEDALSPLLLFGSGSSSSIINQNHQSHRRHGSRCSYYYR